MAEYREKKQSYTRRWKSASKLLSGAEGQFKRKQDEESEEEHSSEEVSVVMETNEEQEKLTPGCSEQPPNSDHSDTEACGLGIDFEVNIDSDSFSDSDKEESSLKDELVLWTNKFQIKHNAVDALLTVLNAHGHDDLPLTARTLLATVKTVETIKKSGMEYIYFPLKEKIVHHLCKYPENVLCDLETLELSFNIDGLPLFKSTQKCMWPVLCLINLRPKIVFPVALTLGTSKPTDLTFIEETVDDLRILIENGLEFQNKILTVKVRCIVCDAPARAMVKSIKQYSGYYGCERCNQKGVWMKKITYQEITNLTLRSDESFRLRTQPEHHKAEVSPFCCLPIDMVFSFSIDYMHQSCLGVMKRLLLTWIRGDKANRMSAGHVAEISAKLIKLKDCIPKTFARKPRSLDEVDRWKATEFRQFLLYTGKYVLKGILRQDLYDHFLTLSVATCILVSKKLSVEHSKYAQILLTYFVEEAGNLYGEGFLVYNDHSMLHITSDAERFGSLDECSGFPFENYLQQLKRMVRSGKNPLSQVVKRLSEVESNKIAQVTTKDEIKTNRPNNAYILDNGKCCEVIGNLQHLDDSGNKSFLCRIYKRTEQYFNYPCDSRLIGVYFAQGRFSSVEILPCTKLNNQAIMIEAKNGRDVIFLSILHDL